MVSARKRASPSTPTPQQVTRRKEVDYARTQVATAMSAEEEFKQRCAAQGASTISDDGTGDMVECQECGTRVRWDLTEHRFFGFAAGCPGVPHEH